MKRCTFELCLVPQTLATTAGFVQEPGAADYFPDPEQEEYPPDPKPFLVQVQKRSVVPIFDKYSKGPYQGRNLSTRAQ